MNCFYDKSCSDTILLRKVKKTLYWGVLFLTNYANGYIMTEYNTKGMDTMKKIISLLLVLTLFISLAPIQTANAATKQRKIRQQLRRIGFHSGNSNNQRHHPVYIPR